MHGNGCPGKTSVSRDAIRLPQRLLYSRYNLHDSQCVILISLNNLDRGPEIVSKRKIAFWAVPSLWR